MNNTYDLMICGGGKVLFSGIVKCDKEHMSNLLDIMMDSRYCCTVFMIDNDED